MAQNRYLSDSPSSAHEHRRAYGRRLLGGVVAAVDMDANQTRTGRRSIRGAVAFAGGSGVECRICGAREWLLVPTLGTSPMEQEPVI